MKLTRSSDLARNTFRGVAVAILLVVFSVPMCAQTIIPNGGFEQWQQDSIFFAAVDWAASYLDSTIFRSTDAHSGLYALGGKVMSDTIGPIARTWYGTWENGYAFPIRSNLEAFEGWYKLNSNGNDYIEIIPFFDNSALAVFRDSTTHNTYTHFSISLPNRGDSGSGIIEIQVGNTSGIVHLGTEFVIDDLAFTGNAAVQPSNQKTFGLEPNYPNPFHNSTTIRYSLPQDDQITLEVLNILGERIALLEEGSETQGKHQIFFDGERFASGPYVCRLITASHGVSSKIIQLSH
ncbi:MAG TPA: T9SS type A sorting domain-containing protein [Candidatus Kapabacteria bacterium]